MDKENIVTEMVIKAVKKAKKVKFKDIKQKPPKILGKKKKVKK